MPKHTVKLIVNPNADLGRAWHKAADLRPVVDEFWGADWTGAVYPTHAIDLARKAGEEGYELVIAMGGSGKHGHFPRVRMGTFRKLDLVADRSLVIHIDGEIFAGFSVDVRKLNLEIFRGAVSALV